MKAPVLLVDIDGLRPDVLQMALDSGQVPTLGEMLPETRTLSVPVLSTAPSITFCAQASLVTGEPPSKHQIVGNQYFDRFGAHSGGRPRHYAFDVGDMLAVDDAVRVFSHGLAESQLSEPTLFTRAGERGLTSVVAGHMYGAGATRWLKPDVIKMGRFIKGKGMVRLEAAAYDGHVVDQLIADIEEHGLADISMVYFLGVDFTSHHEGPEAQMKALVEIVEPHLARLWPVVKGADENVRVVLFSDHGQIEVVADDAHSLRIGFPFDDAWGRFFKALGLDVHDYPGEAPDCEAVVSLNGGMASIDIRGKREEWWEAADFERDVLPVGKALWRAHEEGAYGGELRGGLAGVLVRDVKRDGWEAGYRALTAEGELVSVATWCERAPARMWIDAVSRLERYACRFTGDIVIVSNYEDGYHFGGELLGVHGGLHEADSRATLWYSWPAGEGVAWLAARRRIEAEILRRCEAEGGRPASVTDMLTGLVAWGLW